MKIGLFFGSFNPVHTGHLLIANYFVQFTHFDKIWFIVSPQNPFKVNDTLLDECTRLEMLELAINGDERFKSVGYHEHPLLANHPKIKIFEVPLLNISSTYIREMLQAGKSVKYLVPDAVADFIAKKGLYSGS